MKPIEKIGAFYLGREVDPGSGGQSPDNLMYDARDLTTHAVCVGMTGSGKTGLCIDLLEEAALDGVPAIIIDPKGDITNLLLTFPDLLPSDFEPWVNIDDARRKGLTVEAYAEQVAATWRNGLAEWDQSPDRIRALKDSTDFSIITPGSDAGERVSILSSLEPPELDWETEEELAREQVSGVVSALLGLVGIDADPLRSREYILTSSIIEHYWRQGKTLDLPLLIASVQNPPMERLGVFDIETFFPGKDRFAYAMALNGILASPGFQAWMEGEPLDIGAYLHDPETGKPRHTIFYLAHLSDSERMFFVTLLLERVVSWVRAQSGTTSLRAMLYFDEVFGFFPPVAEPPSKRPLMRLLKQARAFGFGVVLTTQNPIDLDYKGLTNAGTWFIGRLQAERDKKRLLDGLESISSESGTGFDRKGMDGIISSLGKRVFLLHNVHEGHPLLFRTRWAMSYLRGPLTRDQIRKLGRGTGAMEAPRSIPKDPAPAFAAEADGPAAMPDLSAAPPVIPPGIPQVFLPIGIGAGLAMDMADEQFGSRSAGRPDLVYRPSLVAMASVSFVNGKRGIAETQNRGFLLATENTGVVTDWDRAEELDLTVDDLLEVGEENALYSGTVPSEWLKVKELRSISKGFSDHLYYGSRLEVPCNEGLELFSTPGETQAEFEVRCRESAHELRDADIEKLRKKSLTRLDRLETRLSREKRELEEDRSDYRGRKTEELLSAGESIIGMLGIFGSRRSSALSSAARRRRMTSSAKADIEESVEEIERLEGEIENLETEVREEAEAIAGRWDSVLENTGTFTLKPRRADVRIGLVALAWTPLYLFRAEGEGAPAGIPAWKKP